MQHGKPRKQPHLGIRPRRKEKGDDLGIRYTTTSMIQQRGVAASCPVGITSRRQKKSHHLWGPHLYGPLQWRGPDGKGTLEIGGHNTDF